MKVAAVVVLFFVSVLALMPTIVSADTRAVEYGYSGAGPLYVIEIDPFLASAAIDAEEEEKIMFLGAHYIRNPLGGWVMVNWPDHLRPRFEGEAAPATQMPEWLLPDLVKGAPPSVESVVLFPYGGAWVFLRPDCGTECAQAVVRTPVASAR